MSETSDNFVVLAPAFKSDQEPTFILTCDDAGLGWLIERFASLSLRAEPDEFAIGEGGVLSSDGLCRLQVRLGRRSLIARVHEGLYSWTVERAESEEIRDKLEALLAGRGAGHQYFDQPNGDYRTVVVTKSEYSVSTLRSMRDDRLAESARRR